MRTAPRRPGLTLALLACGLAASPAPAFAQTAGTPDASGRSHRGRQSSDAPGSATPRAKPAEVKIPPDLWPRLDRGALFCASLDGLKARAEALARDDGPQPLPPGCRPIAQPTKVTVVDRVPPAAAQIRVDATRELGWTDAWLPEKPPGTAAR